MRDGKVAFRVIEAKGHPLPEAGEPLQWSIRQGCIISTVPAEKVYRLRAQAEARAEELRKTEGQT
jgi:hypothetical protein